MTTTEITTRRRAVLTEHGGPEALVVREEPCPQPGEGEVLVAVEAIGVNFADALVRRGQYLPDAPLELTPGLEVAGVVAAAGPGVDAPSVGARVVAIVDDGGYATAVVASAARTHVVPDDVTFPQAVGVAIQGATAYLALHLYSRVCAREAVLVHAAGGGVGLLAVQLATSAGARVVALASTEEKRRAALKAGASVALMPDPDTLRNALREHAPRGVDVVIDSVGGPLFAPGFKALRRGGRYVVLGAASLEPSMLDTRSLLARSLTISGFVLADSGLAEAGQPGEAIRSVLASVGRGELTQELRTFALDDVVAAHRALDDRAVGGKIVLLPDM